VGGRQPEVNAGILFDQLINDTLTRSIVPEDKKYSVSIAQPYVRGNMESRAKYCKGGSASRVSGTFMRRSLEESALTERLTPRAGLCRKPSMRGALIPNAPGTSLSELETFVVCQNIERYSRLMTEAMTTDKRLTLEKLLAEERTKLLGVRS
jgi:hypothetical protein